MKSRTPHFRFWGLTCTEEPPQSLTDFLVTCWPHQIVPSAVSRSLIIYPVVAGAWVAECTRAETKTTSIASSTPMIRPPMHRTSCRHAPLPAWLNGCHGTLARIPGILLAVTLTPTRCRKRRCSEAWLEQVQAKPFQQNPVVTRRLTVAAIINDGIAFFR